MIQEAGLKSELLFSASKLSPLLITAIPMNHSRLILTFTLMLGFFAGLQAQSRTPLQADFGDAILRDWVQADYPDAAKQAKLEGKVTVEFVVEVDGKVSRVAVKKSTDERFDASALAAVQRWTFLAATAEGKPVASGMEATVIFKLSQLQQKKKPTEPAHEAQPRALPTKPAKLLASPAPEYPAELEDRRLSGEVVLEFTVGTDGVAAAPKVLSATHASFVGEALRVLEKYRFEPASQGPLLLSSTTQGQVEFGSLGASHEELLAINGLTVDEAGKFKRLPQPVSLAEPIYPRERLVAGERGSATVEFTVSERGAVEDISLKDASAPEFGSALLAAVETWAFEPALVEKKSAESKLVVTHKFSPPETGQLYRFLLALQPGGTGVGGAGGLDAPIRPIWRVAPPFPRALKGEKKGGRAVIMFIIDREGRARLPLVKSATQPEFGWAAATAVAQWVFAPPHRGGEAVEVQVSIPVDFAAPKE